MTDSYRTEKLRAGMNQLRIATLIQHLTRSANLLSVDLDREEAQTGVRDPKSHRYSQLALQLRARRDNLLASVELLEARVVPSSGLNDQKHATPREVNERARTVKRQGPTQWQHAPIRTRR